MAETQKANESHAIARFAMVSIPLALVAVLAISWILRAASEHWELVHPRQAFFNCLPFSLYLVQKRFEPGELSRDDLVVWQAEGLEPRFKDGAQMLKRLAGVPGDLVEFSQGQVSVNGRVIGRMTLLKRLGLPPSYSGRYRLRENEFFVVGTTASSYDSRYFGPISGRQLRGKAFVLF